MTEISKLGEFGLIHRLTKDVEPKNTSTKYGVGDDCADDRLLSGFVEDTELHLSLCSDRECEYQQ
jgi:hypothetical protein